MIDQINLVLIIAIITATINTNTIQGINDKSCINIELLVADTLIIELSANLLAA